MPVLILIGLSIRREIPQTFGIDFVKVYNGVDQENKQKVVVRGIAERYNVALLDGVTLPSTDVIDRNFDFNIIPNSLVESIVVSKSYTPDMGFGFGGGMVQIGTLAVPDENFINLSLGGKYSPNITGKDFLGYGRGKYDYFGFDDGIRDHFPEGIFPVHTNNYAPDGSRLPEDATPLTIEQVREQNQRIGDLSRLGVRKYMAMPGHNYSFSIGRSYDLSTQTVHRLDLWLPCPTEMSRHYPRWTYTSAEISINIYKMSSMILIRENNWRGILPQTTSSAPPLPAW